MQDIMIIIIGTILSICVLFIGHSNKEMRKIEDKEEYKKFIRSYIINIVILAIILLVIILAGIYYN